MMWQSVTFKTSLPNCMLEWEYGRHKFRSDLEPRFPFWTSICRRRGLNFPSTSKIAWLDISTFSPLGSNLFSTVGCSMAQRPSEDSTPKLNLLKQNSQSWKSQKQWRWPSVTEKNSPASGCLFRMHIHYSAGKHPKYKLNSPPLQI